MLAPTTGAIHSVVVVHHPVVASFKYPLPVVLVDLDGMPGIRVIMNSTDGPLESLEVGARVRIEVRDANESSADDNTRLPFAIVEPI